MSAAGPSIALVSSSDEGRATTALVERFMGLLERRWDAQLVFDGGAAAWQAACVEPDTGRLTQRVHLSSAGRAGGLTHLVRRGTVARGLLASPSATWKYLCGADGARPSLLRQRQVESVLLALRPQIVHFDSASSAARRLWVRRIFGCKVVVSLGLDDLEAGSALDPVWRGADLIHFQSESSRARWTRNGHLDASRALVVAPGPDTVHFDPRHERATAAGDDSPRPALRIISAGRLSWMHGYEWALQAMRLLLDSGVDCEYRIVGDGPYRDALSFARSQLGLEDRVSFMEANDKTQLRRHLGWADVLLDATVVAGPPSALREAQAMTLPVVATDRTDLYEARLDRQTGFVVPRRDPRSMAEKLALLARDPDGRRRAGDRARQRLLERPEREDEVTAYERLYRAALRG